jgi:hypothetical protein
MFLVHGGVWFLEKSLNLEQLHVVCNVLNYICGSCCWSYKILYLLTKKIILTYMVREL